MTNPATPLAHIRAAELAAARSVTSEAERAEQAITEARRQAVRIVEEARSQGRTAADERFAAAVAAAELRAAEISGNLDARIASVRSVVEPELDRLVDAMVGVVLPDYGTD